MSITGPIVCIEDDQDDQHLMSVAIKELQLTNELYFFSDGESAIQFLIDTPLKPFVIFCDINLPKTNGIELRKRLNDNEYLRKKSIPFIFVSTATSPETVQTAYDVTVQGFFRKPDTYSGLKEQIKLIMSYWKECLHPNSKF